MNEPRLKIDVIAQGLASLDDMDDIYDSENMFSAPHIGYREHYERKAVRFLEYLEKAAES